MITYPRQEVGYCTVCNYPIGNAEMLATHIMNETTDHIRCEGCHNIAFATEAQLLDHMHNSHPCCQDCRCTFETWSDIAHHRRTHHSMCHLCPEGCNLVLDGTFDHFELRGDVQCPANRFYLHSPEQSGQGNVQEGPLKCFGHFTSDGQLLRHLESGMCRSGIDYRAVAVLFLESPAPRWVSGEMMEDSGSLRYVCPACRPSPNFRRAYELFDHYVDAGHQSAEWEDMVERVLLVAANAGAMARLTRLSQMDRMFAQSMDRAIASSRRRRQLQHRP